ncbi:MAG: tetratricopeptide repeat protein [Deltaproteobacteria bacterium]|nr:tetratricopeptide repeat protein [Deltaproteobacteria bacterium]
MDAVTYPEEAVSHFVSENLIPLRIQFNEEPYTSQFRVKWTPTLLILDEKGEEHHRTVGFFEPNQLIPSLMLGIAKAAFDADRFEPALEYLNALLAKYPESNSAPEAIYLRGVSLYKSTKDPKPLKDAYEKLANTYPESEWTNRAYPYRLL